MKARAVNKAYSYSGVPTVTFEVADKDFLNNDMLDGRDIDLSVKALRKKRSLSANAYMWTLINEIASVLRVSNDEIYHQALCKYGTFRKDDGVTEVVTIRADIALSGWLYTHTKPLKTAMLNGKAYTHYAVIKGSSEYDTREMSALLDGIIDDCKSLGIEVMTPEEIQRLNGYEINNTN